MISFRKKKTQRIRKQRINGMIAIYLCILTVIPQQAFQIIASAQVIHIGESIEEASSAIKD